MKTEERKYLNIRYLISTWVPCSFVHRGTQKLKNENWRMKRLCTWVPDWLKKAIVIVSFELKTLVPRVLRFKEWILKNQKTLVPGRLYNITQLCYAFSYIFWCTHFSYIICTMNICADKLRFIAATLHTLCLSQLCIT